MLCLLALLVFATLALFSARYRPLAREAVACVFRRLTLRKCTTALDQRVKAMLTGRLMLSHPAAARFVHRHLEAMAWGFVLVGIVATGYLGYGFYNFHRYGNCNGPTGKGFCIFDPTGTHGRYSGIVTGQRGEMLAPGENGDPALGPENARVTIIEFGSYSCPYTRATEPTTRELVRRYGDEIRFVFRHFPLDAVPAPRKEAGATCEEPSFEGVSAEHAGATQAAIAAGCAAAQGRFWEYHALVSVRPDAIASCAGLTGLGTQVGLDEASFTRCLEDPAMRSQVQRDFEDGVKAGIFGTPTFFINGSVLVAPSAEALFAAVDEALEAPRP